MRDDGSSLEAAGLDVRVPGRTLVSGLRIHVRAGEFVAVLGQNGAGKTLTLHTLAGLRPAAAGDVLLDDVPLADWQRRELARTIGLLPQASEDAFPASVFETVLIGRHPHVGALRLESRRDRDVAERALARVRLLEFRDRPVDTLSGGERRRLAIAQLLTQAPVFNLLDEPLNHLDPRHQLEVLGLFRALADDGAAVVATLHDVNLARRYADSALLLFGDGDWEFGDAQATVNADNLRRLFGVAIDSLSWRDQEVFIPVAD